MRRALIHRRTKETTSAIRLGLEGKGRYDIRTGIRFFDHMLELVSRHGGFDLAKYPNVQAWIGRVERALQIAT